MLSPAYIQKILEQECGVKPGAKLLLTVSGGMDSMVLMDVVIKAGYECEAAHCNFNLRGGESDGDEQLVREECKKRGVVLHVRSFDTKVYARENGISIEMAARDLRYDWFHELLEVRELDFMLTAHHGDDAVETFFLNLVRGTGIKGLSGIKAINGRVVRPLLELSRNEIEKYAESNAVRYRHDSTNDDVKYMRNKVRHEIIPRFKEMNPSFIGTMKANLKRLAEVEGLLDAEVKRFRDEFVVEEGGRVLIPIRVIAPHPQKTSILHEILAPYGFSPRVVNDIVRGLDGIPGKQFYSENYRLIRDRHNLILLKKEEVADEAVFIDAGTTEIDEPFEMSIRVFDKTEDYSFSTNPLVAHFDTDIVEFPLILRRWQQGDTFRPLGMKGFKKLSDFFTDQKLSVVDKENVWVLQTGDDVMWVVGMRIDDRYKITARTRKVIELKVGKL